MLTLTSVEMNTWIAALLWPLTRILGLIAFAPLFGNAAVPVSIKGVLGILLALIIAPAIPALPVADPMSLAGLMILLREMLIGLAMGLVMRILFSAFEMAGEMASMTMGMGFASFFDPLSAGHSSAISQFLVLVATLVFMAANAHLLLLQALAESFITMPVSATPIAGAGPLELARWGERIFSAGLQLSLPIIAALLITNIALGILARAAPQLNLFALGFPITLAVGLLLVGLTLPYLNTPIQNLFHQGIEAVRLLPRAAAPAVPNRQ